MKTITSANAVLIITVEDIYPNGVEVQKFAADAAFATSDLTLAETRMGVDGQLAAGYTPQPIPLNVSLEADSPSYDVFANVMERQRTNMTLYQITAQITIPSLGKEFVLEKGVLQTGHPFSDSKKVLDPTSWGFVFESFHSASI